MQGDCQWPLKNGGNSHQSCLPTIHCYWCNPNLHCLNDSDNTTRQGLCSSLILKNFLPFLPFLQLMESLQIGNPFLSAKLCNITSSSSDYETPSDQRVSAILKCADQSWLLRQLVLGVSRARMIPLPRSSSTVTKWESHILYKSHIFMKFIIDFHSHHIIEYS